VEQCRSVVHDSTGDTKHGDSSESGAFTDYRKTPS